MLRALDLASASWPFFCWPRKAGRAIAARMPMIRITTRSSMSVKPFSSPLIRWESFRSMGTPPYGDCGLARHLGSRPRFCGGNSAGCGGMSLPFAAPELCVPASRRVCLYHPGPDLLRIGIGDPGASVRHSWTDGHCGQNERGADRSARPSATTSLRPLGLPVVALRVSGRLAAALRPARACTGRDAGGRALRDRERVGRLRGRDDGVTRAGARGRDRDLTLARADVEAGVAELRRRGAVRVVAGGVGGARLDLRDRVTRVRLRLGVLALLLLAEEGRQSDRGKNADDQDHDEKLDEGEALLLAVDPLGKLPQHCHSSLEPVVWPDTSAAPSLVAARPAPAG